MNTLVSIIVPVYNVEKYLERCIQSILEQNYKNLEIILVDDGSTDNSGEICDKYAKEDSRIVVYHKQNGGLSSARNYGIERAHGAFISFIDSDDFVNKRYVEILMDNCGCDNITICFNEKVNENAKLDTEDVGFVEKEELTSDEAIVRFFNDNIYVSAWGKLYPAAFFSDIRFPKGKIYEDYATTYKLYAKAKMITVAKVKCYYYTIRTSSITGKPFSSKNLDMFDVVDDIESHLNRYVPNSDIREAFYGSKAKCLLYLYYMISKSDDAYLYKEKQLDIIEYVKSKRVVILNSSKVNAKIKLAVLVFCINKKAFTWFMRRIYNK